MGLLRAHAFGPVLGKPGLQDDVNGVGGCLMFVQELVAVPTSGSGLSLAVVTVVWAVVA